MNVRIFRKLVCEIIILLIILLLLLFLLLLLYYYYYYYLILTHVPILHVSQNNLKF